MLDTLNTVQRMCGQGGAAAAPGGVSTRSADAEDDADGMDTGDGANAGGSVGGALVQPGGLYGGVGGPARVQAGFGHS